MSSQLTSESTSATNGPSYGECLWCGHRSFECAFERVTDRLRYVKGSWDFARCLACGSLQLVPLPDQKKLASFYPTCYDPMLFGEDTVVSFTRPKNGKLNALIALNLWIVHWLKRLEKLCFYNISNAMQTSRVMRAISQGERQVGNDSFNGKEMLDLGCGKGMRMVEFQRSGFRVQGIDFQLASVEYVRTQLQLPAWHLNVTELANRFPHKSYDVISAFYLFEHIDDIESVICSCAKLLRDRGTLVFAVPMADSIQARIFGGRWSQITEAPRHLSLPTHIGIQQLLSRTGFRQLAILPENTLGCAAIAGLSIFPNSAATFASNNPGFLASLYRVAGAVASLFWLPLAFIENVFFKRPAACLVVATKECIAIPEAKK